MTGDDALAVMAIIQTAYPRFYANADDESAAEAAKLWAVMFCDDDVCFVLAAVKAFIASDTKGFPPHIGAIKEQMRKLAQGENGEMTEMEAWELVRKASANGIYNSAAEFAKLPVTIQKVLGDASVLREYAVTDIETLNSVISSNFQRSYRARAGYEREWMKLPAEVQLMFGGTGAVKRIEKGYDEHLLPAMQDVHSMEGAREAEANDPRYSYSAPPQEFFDAIRQKCAETANKTAIEQGMRLKKLFGGKAE